MDNKNKIHISETDDCEASLRDPQVSTSLIELVKKEPEESKSEPQTEENPFMQETSFEEGPEEEKRL